MAQERRSVFEDRDGDEIIFVGPGFVSARIHPNEVLACRNPGQDHRARDERLMRPSLIGVAPHRSDGIPVESYTALQGARSRCLLRRTAFARYPISRASDL